MHPARILIVDDEIGASRLLKVNLELTGRYEVRVENRPENAIDVARQFKPHLALVDVIMPRISGVTLADTLQADPELRSIRIVFLTAAPGPLMPAETANALCRFPCIPKPANMQDIIPAIEKNLPL